VFVSQCAAAINLHIGDNDPRALGHKFINRRFAYPAGSTGNDGNLPFQSL
jgi:hypothetical protein